ncbi:MAG: GTPase-activating protein S13 [Chaenotheca gracillima]|nr:MAG: GTPase-activating protein S13 [Chaenotheca gracillima]
MATPIQQNLVNKNGEYASKFDQGSLALPPAKSYAIVTCMDARIDPAPAFGIALGDAHVIRNAGANARNAIRDLVISEQFLATKEVLLIKHTGCGMLTFTNDFAHDHIAKTLGPEAAAEIKDVNFNPFPDLENAVKDDVAYLKASKVIPEGITISGWVYEVETGKVKSIV